MKKGWKIVLIIICVLVLIVAAGFGYLYTHGLSGLYVNSQPEEGQIRIACVGDSITYGHGISGWKDNQYPAVLQQILGDDYNVANFGSSGACVNPQGDQPYIGRAVYQESLDYKADILVFMLGTNDAKPENWSDAENFLTQYEALLSTYLMVDQKPKVYIGLCAEAFYVDGQSSGLAQYDIDPTVVDEIVLTLRKLSIEAEILDIHTMTEAHPEWFETDGVHPNKDGARAIAEYIAAAVQQE